MIDIVVLLMIIIRIVNIHIMENLTANMKLSKFYPKKKKEVNLLFEKIEIKS